MLPRLHDQDYYSKYGRDYWMKDIDADMLYEWAMNRALKEQNSDCWINGRRRDHGADRAAANWEGKKLTLLPCGLLRRWSYYRGAMCRVTLFTTWDTPPG